VASAIPWSLAPLFPAVTDFRRDIPRSYTTAVAFGRLPLPENSSRPTAPLFPFNRFCPAEVNLNVQSCPNSYRIAGELSIDFPLRAPQTAPTERRACERIHHRGHRGTQTRTEDRAEPAALASRASIVIPKKSRRRAPRLSLCVPLRAAV